MRNIILFIDNYKSTFLFPHGTHFLWWRNFRDVLLCIPVIFLYSFFSRIPINILSFTMNRGKNQKWKENESLDKCCRVSNESTITSHTTYNIKHIVRHLETSICSAKLWKNTNFLNKNQYKDIELGCIILCIYFESHFYINIILYIKQNRWLIYI